MAEVSRGRCSPTEGPPAIRPRRDNAGQRRAHPSTDGCERRKENDNGHHQTVGLETMVSPKLIQESHVIGIVLRVMVWKLVRRARFG